MGDELDDFLKWFLAAGPTIGLVPATNTVKCWGEDSNGSSVTTAVWYRRDNFQVELIIASPNCIIPEHTHPNVDSYELLVGGQMRFSYQGKWVIPETFITDVGDKGLSPYRGNTIRVNHNDLHGGVAGPAGAVFFSVQKWLNGVGPMSVGDDWDGLTVSKQHQDIVNKKEAVYIDDKTPTMAASLELIPG